MLDYAFFALWFLVAQGLAPAGASTLTLGNEQHPEQRMHWVREGDGRWAMTINGRALGHFRRDAEAVIHETGQRDPDRYVVGELLEEGDLRQGAARVRLRGRFAPTILRAEARSAEREGPFVRITDPSRRLTPVALHLRAGP